MHRDMLPLSLHRMHWNNSVAADLLTVWYAHNTSCEVISMGLWICSLEHHTPYTHIHAHFKKTTIIISLKTWWLLKMITGWFFLLLFFAAADLVANTFHVSRQLKCQSLPLILISIPWSAISSTFAPVWAFWLSNLKACNYYIILRNFRCPNMGCYFLHKTISRYFKHQHCQRPMYIINGNINA